MKKIMLTIIFMVLLFYYGIINARVVSFDNGYNQTITYFEIFGFRFNYLQEN